jgi:hypothetical protein
VVVDLPVFWAVLRFSLDFESAEEDSLKREGPMGVWSWRGKVLEGNAVVMGNADAKKGGGSRES